MSTSPTSLGLSTGLSDRWRSLSLTKQFVLTGGLVMLIGMLINGLWVARQIEEGVTENSAITTALYIDSFISPLTRELETSNTLSTGPIRALDEVFKDSPAGRRLVSVKIWKPDGTIVYATDYDQIGKKYKVTEDLKRAMSGKVAAGFDDLDDEEDAKERQSGLPLLEIYSPIRAAWSGNVIAVAEFYEDGTDLKKTIATAQFQSWLVVAAIMATMAALLMTIVHKASKTIDRQNNILSAQLVEVTEASEQNSRLRQRVQGASERVTELNEQFLKRTSAELHDGPAQLLSFAVLRLKEAGKIEHKEGRVAQLGVIENALNDAVTEIRNVCKGLSLPDIEKLSLRQIIERICGIHKERTQTRLSLSMTEADFNPPAATKICIYRFIQEALNNAWKHAPESEVRVSYGHCEQQNALRVTVEDDGPGFDAADEKTDADNFGLRGLRERVRSIGGEIHIDSSPENGTSLVLEVNLIADLELRDEIT